MAGVSPSRVIQLTDGNQSKPTKASIEGCTVSFLLKEAKNKLRKKYAFVVYQACVTTVCGDKASGQLVRTDDELRSILQGHDAGQLCFLFTNKEPKQDGRNIPSSEEHTTGAVEDIVVARTNRGISYVIGHEDITEHDAVSQLTRASELPGCIFAIGMPDLHAGRGVPIGAAVMTEEQVAYPQLVDNDIGCGMSFVETSLQRGSMGLSKAKKIAASLESIDGPYGSIETMRAMGSDAAEWCSRQLTPLPQIDEEHYQHLGTVGGGNHFAEFQEFQDIYDEAALEKYGIDSSRIHLLVHSGSRSLGSQYLKRFCDDAADASKGETGQSPTHGHYAVDTASPVFDAYLQNHDTALNYAARNRKLIARRLLEQVTGETEPECKIDIYHNFMERVDIHLMNDMRAIAEQGRFPKNIPPVVKGNKQDRTDGTCTCGWLHRKGATPTNQSRVLVIPGSRGSLSYLVEVNVSKDYASGYSLAHGAGRRMARSKALKVHQKKFPNANRLLQTELDSVVVCDKKELIYEEAPNSYKEIDCVVGCLADGDDNECIEKRGREGGLGLVKVLATLKPLLTYKYKNPYDMK